MVYVIPLISDGSSEEGFDLWQMRQPGKSKNNKKSGANIKIHCMPTVSIQPRTSVKGTGQGGDHVWFAAACHVGHDHEWCCFASDLQPCFRRPHSLLQKP
jgi:hypothetical protein